MATAKHFSLHKRELRLKGGPVQARAARNGARRSIAVRSARLPASACASSWENWFTQEEELARAEGEDGRVVQRARAAFEAQVKEQIKQARIQVALQLAAEMGQAPPPRVLRLQWGLMDADAEGMPRQLDALLSMG